MGECHDRMPAVLHPDDISEWRSVDTHWNWLYIRATLIGGVTNLQRFVVEFGMAKLRSAEDFALKNVVEGARKFSYLYDFGDRWIHEIEITNVLEHDPTRIYPVCVAGENACPPENCGGPLGFEELKEVLAGKASEEKADCLEGLGGFYYPFSFDPNFVNRYLLWADSEPGDDSDEFDV